MTRTLNMLERRQKNSYSFCSVTTGAKTSTRHRTQSNNHSNISELLDNLLHGYDNSVRPDFGGPPATVEVDIMVRSMGPISEVDMVGFIITNLKKKKDIYFCGDTLSK